MNHSNSLGHRNRPCGGRASTSSSRACTNGTERAGRHVASAPSSPFSLGALSLLVFVATACSAPAPSDGVSSQDAVQSRSDAIWGGAIDTNTPEANVAVSIVTPDPNNPNVASACTGVLVTPRAVITAAHCIETVEARRVRVGNDSNSWLDVVDAHASATYPHQYDTVSPQDFGIVWLDDSIVSNVRSRRPLLSAPNLGTVSIAGWSPYDIDGGTNPVHNQWRTVGSFGRNALSHHPADDGTALWEFSGQLVGGQHGDSGGPIFFTEPDGSRGVFGIFSGMSISDPSHCYYVDLSASAARTWIDGQMLDKNHDGGHSLAWYAKHGKNRDTMWFGEVDATGYTLALNCPSDKDCDGWFDHHDNCPDVPNTDQVQTGPGEAGDACDPDADGIEDAVDNCPSVKNADQANCNLAYEVANLRERLGDACDPVPCPGIQTVSGYSSEELPGPYNCPPTIDVHKITDTVTVTPVVPHVLPTAGVIPPIALDIGAQKTEFRFCQPVNAFNGASIVDCTDRSVLNDAQLDRHLKSVNKPARDPSRPWQRITIARKASDFPGQSSAPIDRDLDTTTSYGIDINFNQGSHQSIVWDYVADDRYWHNAATPTYRPLGMNTTNATCRANASFVRSSCLDGYVWSHVDSPIGNTNGYVSGVFVGFHGSNLANSITPIRPYEQTELINQGCWTVPVDDCSFSAAGCMPDVSDIKFRLAQCINCSPSADAISRDRLQVPVVIGDDFSDGSPGLSVVVAKDYTVRAQELDLPWDVAESLKGAAGVRFTTAVETAPPEDGAIDAIGLPRDLADTSILAQYLVMDSSAQGAMRIEYKLASRSAVASSSSTTALVGRAAYSRTLQGAFIVGLGEDAYFEPIHGSRYYLGSLTGVSSVQAVTLTRPNGVISGMEPALLWTVEEHEGEEFLSVREVTRYQVASTPLDSVRLSGDFTYELATAWDRPDEVILTAREPGGHWAAFDVRYGYEELSMETRFVFDALVNWESHSSALHLYRGVYCEEGGLVLPLVAVTQAAQINGFSHGPTTERIGLDALGIAHDVHPNLLGDYVW